MKKSPINVQAVTAECIGTFWLCLAVLLTASAELAVPTPVAAALTLLLMVYIIGPVSGAHCNPAITLAVFSTGKISVKETSLYVALQSIGGLLAFLLFVILTDGSVPPTVAPDNAPFVILMEALGTAMLALGVSSVVYERTAPAASGLVVGGSLLLGIVVASVASAGVLNPAVAVVLGASSWSYLVSPIVGAVIGMQIGRYFYS